MKKFVTLRSFALESMLERNTPNASDIEIAFGFGVMYANKFEEYLNEKFDILDFSSNDNDIVKSISCLTTEGKLSVELTKDHLNGMYTISITEDVESSVKNTSILYEDYKTFEKSINEQLGRKI